MKRRLLSLFLAFVTILSLLPTAAFAASSEEDALGEVDIYNGDYELGYLAINGAVKKQKYTYFLYESNDGSTKESPAYCVNPNQYGVPQTVGPGESIKYLANEKASDPKVVGIISNGYPHRSLGELGLENKYQAFYATKMALWCYLIPSWDISNLKVAPGLSGDELDRGNRILAAAKDIYKRGTTYNYMLTPRMTVTADKSTAYPVTIGGQEYKQQVFTVWSETWVYNYDVSLAFSDPDSVPEGTKIVDTNNNEITAVTTKYTSDGYAGTFKVLYPADSVEGQSGNVQLSLSAPVAQYAAMYAVCQEKDQYGDLQNYICDLDNKVQLDVAAVSSYTDSGEPDPDETALKIVKLEEGTEIPLEGAVFSVYDPEGKKVGSYSTGPDGTVTIPLTLEGHYTVTEEIPPRYHLLPEETTQHADVEYNKTATLTFWNAPYGSLRVEKWSDTGDALSGVTIQIKHIETGETRTGQTRNGVIVFDKLAPGGWEVRELAGIDGWVADTDTVQTVAVVSGEESTATFINKELPGLRIIKYERGSMELMPGVSFEIFRDAESLGIFRTDQFGEILLTDCEPGTYRVEERDTGGDGHVLDTTPQEVELKAGDGIKELVFFNDRLPGIHLIKVDSADLSKPIANARFRIKAVDGSWGPEEYTTSEDGTIDLSKLPVGAYVVTELECPGYVVDDAQRIIHLDGNEQAQFVAVPGAVRVNGVDAKFARAQLLAAPGPGHGVQAHAFAPAVDDDFVARRDLRAYGHGQHVHAHHHSLGTKSRRALLDKLRIFDRRRVDRNLFGPGQKHGAHVCHAGDAAAHGKGDENLRGHALHHVQKDAPGFGRGRDVVKHDFVRAFFIVAAGAFHRVADVLVARKTDALGEPAVAHVQTGNDTLTQHGGPRSSDKSCAAGSDRGDRFFPDGTARPKARPARTVSRTPARTRWWPAPGPEPAPHNSCAQNKIPRRGPRP